VERCPFDAERHITVAAETTGYLGRAKLRLMRRDYIVFMPRFLAFLRPLEPRLTWLPMGAQYVVRLRSMPDSKQLISVFVPSEREQEYRAAVSGLLPIMDQILPAYASSCSSRITTPPTAPLKLIERASATDDRVRGLRFSRNFGFQNVLSLRPHDSPP